MSQLTQAESVNSRLLPSKLNKERHVKHLDNTWDLRSLLLEYDNDGGCYHLISKPLITMIRNYSFKFH